MAQGNNLSRTFQSSFWQCLLGSVTSVQLFFKAGNVAGGHVVCLLLWYLSTKTLFLKGGQNIFHYEYKIKAGKNVKIKV